MVWRFGLVAFQKNPAAERIRCGDPPVYSNSPLLLVTTLGMVGRRAGTPMMENGCGPEQVHRSKCLPPDVRCSFLSSGERNLMVTDLISPVGQVSSNFRLEAFG